MPKIYFGHPKDGESESVELRALGLKYNKAEPSRIGLIGLRTLEQPGYESYIHHIAGFMFANDTKEKQKLNQVGFPIRHPITSCIPVLQPPLHIKIKGSDTEKFEVLFRKNELEYTKSKQRTGKDEFTTFTVSNAISALGPLRSVESLRSHAPSGQVSFNGFLAYLLAIRIFSSFYKAHTYPAYSAPTEEEDYSGLKRRIIESEESRKQLKMDKTGGVPVTEADVSMNDDPNQTEPEDKVVLRYAKPGDSTVLPWGNSLGDIPNTHGIVFPFVHQLSNWDKDMVPLVMERHFIRCFGSNDKGISTAYSSFVESWKSEVYSTHSGLVLAHMAKIIMIALPAQARPFPLFENGQYRGCYLSGANCSIALKANLVRPESFANNQDDLRQMFGKERLLDWLSNEVITDDDDKEEFLLTPFKTLREVDNFLFQKTIVPDNENQLIKAKAMAANANFEQSYLPVTVDNVLLMVTTSLDGNIDASVPLHHEAFWSTDPFEKNLSAFGPGVPSPHIPGGKEITNFKQVPAQSSACFRRCQLRSAVSEWKDVIENGSVRNEPRNLNARFQFVKVSGTEEKGKWYRMMDTVITVGRERGRGGIVQSGAESMIKKLDGSAAIDELFAF
jgi:hypothetical protein